MKKNIYSKTVAVVLALSLFLSTSGYSAELSKRGALRVPVSMASFGDNRINTFMNQVYMTEDVSNISPLKLVEIANRLNKSFSAGDISRSEIEQFYNKVIEQSLTLPDKDTSKAIQIISGQSLNIIHWIAQDLPGAKDIEVTANRDKMAKNDERGDSYLKSKTLPADEVAKEGACGFYWRGAEGAGKLGANLNMSLAYNVEMAQAVKDRLVLYIMDHGFIDVPEAIWDMTAKGILSAIHETSFVNDIIPGSTQMTSTGKGHFQGNSLDIKYVTEGRGIQFNVRYNAEGQIEEVLAHEITKDSWTVALPGYVDYVVNLGGLRFNDISVKLSDRDAKKLNPEFDFSKTAEIGNMIEDDSKVSLAPYLAVKEEGKFYLVQNTIVTPLPIWIKGPKSLLPEDGLMAAYQKLSAQSLQEDFIDKLINFIDTNIKAKVSAAQIDDVSKINLLLENGEVLNLMAAKLVKDANDRLDIMISQYPAKGMQVNIKEVIYRERVFVEAMLTVEDFKGEIETITHEIGKMGGSIIGYNQKFSSIEVREEHVVGIVLIIEGITMVQHADLRNNIYIALKELLSIKAQEKILLSTKSEGVSMEFADFTMDALQYETAAQNIKGLIDRGYQVLRGDGDFIIYIVGNEKDYFVDKEKGLRSRSGVIRNLASKNDVKCIWIAKGFYDEFNGMAERRLEYETIWFKDWSTKVQELIEEGAIRGSDDTESELPTIREWIAKNIKEARRLEEGYHQTADKEAVKGLLDNPAPVEIINPIAPYKWGGHTKEDGAPAYLRALRRLPAPIDPTQGTAEMWIGGYPDFPSTALIGGYDVPLQRAIEKSPEDILGLPVVRRYGDKMPILLKISEAEEQLSTQAHPNNYWAERLKKLDIKNYPDDIQKIEAWAGLDDEGVKILAGFKNINELENTFSKFSVLLKDIIELTDFSTGEMHKLLLNYSDYPEFEISLKKIINRKMSKDELRALLDFIDDFKEDLSDKRLLQREYFNSDAFIKEQLSKAVNLEPDNIRDVAVDLFSYLIHLKKGECSLIEPRKIHAVVSGRYIEIQTNCNDTVRAANTDKQLDKDNLIAMLNYKQGRPKVYSLESVAHKYNELIYNFPTDRFGLGIIEMRENEVLDDDSSSGFRMLVCLTGRYKIRYSKKDGKFTKETKEFSKGDSVFIPANLGEYEIQGLDNDTQIVKTFVPASKMSKLILSRQAINNYLSRDENKGLRLSTICDNVIHNALSTAKLDPYSEFSRSPLFSWFDEDSHLRSRMHTVSNVFNQKEDLENLVAEVQREDPDRLIVIGSSVTLDVGQYISYRLGIPVIFMPTAFSTNTAFGYRSYLHLGQDQEGEVITSLVPMPEEVVADIDLIELFYASDMKGLDKEKSKRIAKAGVGDILAVYTALADWDIAVRDRPQERKDDMIHKESEVVLRELESRCDDINQLNRNGLIWLIENLYKTSKMTIDFGTSRTQSGSEHLLSDAVEVERKKQSGRITRDYLHGEKIALCVILMRYLQNPIKSNWQKTKELVGKLGLPTRPEDVGLTKEIFIDALLNVKTRPDKYTWFDTQDGRALDRETAKTAVNLVFGTKDDAINDITIADIGLKASLHKEVVNENILKLIDRGNYAIAIPGLDDYEIHVIGNENDMFIDKETGQRAHAGGISTIGTDNPAKRIWITKGFYVKDPESALDRVRHEAEELDKWWSKTLELLDSNKIRAPNNTGTNLPTIREWIANNIKEAQALQQQFHEEAEKGAIDYLIKNPKPVKMTPQIAEYDWGGVTLPDGSPSPLRAFLGLEAKDAPAAEIWIGDNAKLPSIAQVGGEDIPLDKVIEQNPEASLGIAVVKRYGRKLPLLFKISYAMKQLSNQIHPNNYWSRIIKRDRPDLYNDEIEKIEAWAGVDDKGVWIYVGFKTLDEINDTFISFNGLLNDFKNNPSSHPYRKNYPEFAFALEMMKDKNISKEDIESIQRFGADFVTRLFNARIKTDGLLNEEKFLKEEYEKAVNLTPYIVRDVVINLFSYLIHLKKGECSLIPPRILHAIASGMYAEIQSNCDNTLRSGNTTKPLDDKNFFPILNVKQGPVSINYLEPMPNKYQELSYDLATDKFDLNVIRLRPGSKIDDDASQGFRILVCWKGSFKMRYGKEQGAYSQESDVYSKGEVLFIPANMGEYEIVGLSEGTEIFKVFVPASRMPELQCADGIINNYLNKLEDNNFRLSTICDIDVFQALKLIQHTANISEKIPWFKRLFSTRYHVVNRVFEREEEIEGLVERIQIENPDRLIVIGSSTTINLGRLIALELGIPVIFIPSVFANGNAFGYEAHMHLGKKQEGKRIDELVPTPEAVIADLDFMNIFLKFPPFYDITKRANIAGAGEILGLYTALRDWEIAVEAGRERKDPKILNECKKILRNLEENIERIRIEETSKDIYEYLYWLVNESYAISEQSMLFGTSRPETGSSHILGYQIGNERRSMRIDKSYLHGEKIALCAILMSYLQGDGDGNWKNVLQLAEKLGLPTKPRDIGLNNMMFVNSLLRAVANPRPDKYTWFDTGQGKSFTKEQAEAAVNTVFGEEYPERKDIDSSL